MDNYAYAVLFLWQKTNNNIGEKTKSTLLYAEHTRTNVHSPTDVCLYRTLSQRSDPVNAFSESKTGSWHVRSQIIFLFVARCEDECFSFIKMHELLISDVHVSNCRG